MQAWVVREHGEPKDVLQVETMPRPTPGPGEALVAVSACGLNFPDVLQCRGQYHDRAPLPFVPGMEVVGTVVTSDTLKTGQRVIAMPRLPDGGLAQYCLVPERDVFTVPDALSDELAAGFLITYQTAWLALHHRASARSGETVLVHGAAGGVGLACVQVARAAGLRVIGTARGPRRTALVASAGADLVVDTSEADFVAQVMELTDGHGADIVIDPIGGDVFTRSRRCIAWGGRHVVIGFMSNEIPTVPANLVLLKNYSVVGLNMGAYPLQDPGTMRQAHAALIGLFLTGALRPVLHETGDPHDARSSLQDLADGAVTGKSVVLPFRA